jgi:hypothetical protein
MKTQFKIEHNKSSLKLTLLDSESDYFSWEELSVNNLFFEYSSGNKIIKDRTTECTIMKDGIHISLSSGEVQSFYLNGISHSEYNEIIESLKIIYRTESDQLEIYDN